MARVAAAGDVHASEATRERIAAAFSAVECEADLVLLAGDLTTHGEPEQARVLAEAAGGLRVPVAAVLGNHDLHSGRGDEVAAILRDAGFRRLPIAPPASCFFITRRPRTPCTASPRASGRISVATASPLRSRNIVRTSSSTGMRTAEASKARSAKCPCTTSQSTSRAA